MDVNKYGIMLLYAIFKKEINEWSKEGARIFMFRFSSSDNFLEWVSNGKYEGKINYTCYLIDSNASKAIEINLPEAIQALRSNDDSVILVPYVQNTDNAVFIHSMILKSDCMDDEGAKRLVNGHPIHCSIK